MSNPTNSNAKHYFKESVSSLVQCAQCGEPICSDRHVRVRDIQAQAEPKPAPQRAYQPPEFYGVRQPDQ